MSPHKQMACTVVLRSRRRIASAKGALCLIALALFVAPVTAQASGTLYVTDRGSDDVFQYAIGAGSLLSPLTPATVATGTEPLAIAVTPDGKSAYVTNRGGAPPFGRGRTVSQYSINPVTGALSPKVPATVATGTSPTRVAITPDGKSAYVVNEDDNTVSEFNIDPSSGALSPKAPATVAAGGLPFDVAVTPDGKSAYVTDDRTAAISQFNIDPSSGALSPKAPATVAATGSIPFAIVVAPQGKSAYVTNLGGSISQYNVDPLTGGLSPKSPAIVATGPGPEGVVVTPDGRNAYVSNGDNTISQYTIDSATGALAPKTPATVAARGTGVIAVTPDGKSAYVTNSADNSIGQYDIEASSGALAPKAPPTIAAGNTPAGIAVGPLPLLPTSKAQCKDSGWRTYPQFKNRGRCVAFVVKEARQRCLTERARIGLLTFRDKYGVGRYHVFALRRCVNQASR